MTPVTPEEQAAIQALLREQAPRAAEAQQRLQTPAPPPPPEDPGVIQRLLSLLAKVGRLSDAVPTPPQNLREAANMLPDAVMPKEALDSLEAKKNVGR